MNRLDKETVKLISSGQVVTSVSNVVKELIENALDAEASNIEIRLANFGLDCIEVKDNGNGVQSQQIDFMVKGHYTSKLKDFQDLNALNTYGFRGEALNSLCSVCSNLEIISKTENDQLGSQVKFDKNGQKIKDMKIATTRGTIIKGKLSYFLCFLVFCKHFVVFSVRI